MRCRVKPFGIAGSLLLQKRNKVNDGANVTSFKPIMGAFPRHVYVDGW